MDDLSETLNSILSDPSAMEQIKALGGMLGISPQQGAQQVSPPPVQPVHPQPPPAASSMTSALSGMNMPNPEMLGMIMKFAPLLGKMNEENESTRLLYALRPFLSEKRRPRVDQAIRMLGMMRMLPLLKEIM